MANRRPLPAVFDEKVMVFDGAMGSLLHERGASRALPFEELNLSSPYLVCQAHADYITAGADAIETNTFAANRFTLSRYGLGDKTVEINAAGARLAKGVASSAAVVVGSIGPPGVRLEPIGPVTAAELQAAVAEQVRALADGGVDAILMETQADLQLLRLMLESVLDTCELPVMLQFAVGADLTTSAGDTVDDIALAAAQYPVASIGLNCSIGPDQIIRAVQALRQVTGLPISAQPNAGYPSKVEGRTVFAVRPEYFAERAVEMVDAGAGIVGGCCGTTPAHIAAIAARVKSIPVPQPVQVREPARRESLSVSACTRSPMLRRMTGKFVTVEVTPPKDADYHGLIDKLRPLVDAGISAIDVTDNPVAHVHMSAISFAHIVKEELGVDTILHLTCRDLNLLGMHSALLGASALGIDGILALTGDPASAGDYPDATSVYDVTSDGLARIVSSLNCGVDCAGRQIGRPTNFAIGAAFNPAAEDLEREIQRLEKKREAGVNFLMTQPVFEVEVLECAVRMLPDDWQPPILVGVLPLRSSRHAEFLHNEVPGIVIPQEIRRRLAEAGSDEAKAEGVRAARKIYRAAADYGGVYFMPPFGSFDVVREVITED